MSPSIVALVIDVYQYFYNVTEKSELIIIMTKLYQNAIEIESS